MNTLVGRQPIFDRQLHEPFYRLRCIRQAAEGECANDENVAACELIDVIVNFGLEKLVGNRRACVTLTRDFIAGRLVLPFQAHEILLELPDQFDFDAAILDSLQNLADQGFKIVLNPFVDLQATESLLEIADIARFDLRTYDKPELEERLQLVQSCKTQALIEEVDTLDEFEDCRQLGFDFFQGEFLCRPNLVRGKLVSVNRLAVAQLLGKLYNPTIEIEELEQLVCQEVSLSYRILKYINSATVGIPNTIDSIKQAVMLLGLKNLKRLCTLVALGGLDEKPVAVIEIAMVRARMCELLAIALGEKRAESFFTVGLLSTLDAMLDRPIDKILEELPLADDIKQALLSADGVLGQALQCTLALERAQWSEAECLHLDKETICRAYLEAIAWMQEDSAIAQLVQGNESSADTTENAPELLPATG